MNKWLKDFFSGLFFSRREEKIEEKDEVQITNDLCEEWMDVAQKRIRMLKALEELKDREKQLEGYSQFSEKEIKKIRELLLNYQAIAEEKESLKGRLISKNKALSVLQKHEKEIPQLMKEIKEAEEKQRKIKRDIDYLVGEKEALIYAKEQLQKAIVIIRRISLFAVGIFCIAAMILSVLFIQYEVRILLPGAITAVIAIILGTWLYIFQRQAEYEIKKNNRMYARAIKLLNKAKLRYVHFTNFLAYEYDKFKVDSTEQLERHWALYQKNKHHEKRFFTITSSMSQIESEVEYILEKRGIHLDFLEDIKEWNDIEKRKQMSKDIGKERKNIEYQLESLDIYHQEIWEQLVDLKEKDQTQEQVIDKMIQSCLVDMEKLLSSP